MDAATLEKQCELPWNQVVDGMDILTTTSTPTTWPLDEYRLIRITATCTSPTSNSYDFTITRALGYCAAVREFETGKRGLTKNWSPGHGQLIDSIKSQSRLAKVLQTWGSETCGAWTDVAILVTSGEVRSFTMRRAEHVCYEEPPAYSE